MQTEKRSRQHEEETSVIMKTEELRGGQETQKRGADNLYKNGQSAKSLEQENNLEVVPDTNQGF